MLPILSLTGLAAAFQPVSECTSSADEALRLLTAVLPTFIAIAKSVADDLPDRCPGEAPEITETRDFYHEYYTKAVNVEAGLRINDVEGAVSWPVKTIRIFRQLLEDMNGAFLSPKNPEITEIYRQLGFEYRKQEEYGKLRALFRILPEDDKLNEASLALLSRTIRLQSKRTADRAKILGYFDRAFDILTPMDAVSDENPACPRHFSRYPVKHVCKVSKTLFNVLEKSWNCNCYSDFHLKRAMKLNLTQHQCFETARPQGYNQVQQNVLFRIMFPTKHIKPRWQDADIAVRERLPQGTPKDAIENNLCGIIEEAKLSIVPNIMVFEQKLWRIRSKSDASGPIKVPDGEFMTLRELLEQQHGRTTLLSCTHFKERVVLSVIIVTTFIHLYNISEHDLQATLTTDTICFQVKYRSYDIKRPYLNMHFMKMPIKPKTHNLGEAHCLPDILSLGILLLQILRGTELELLDDQDRCVQALSAQRRWRETQGNVSSGFIREGCFNAVSACLEPTQLQESRLDCIDITDDDIRQYIFERILYPLEECLLNIYETPLQSLCDASHGQPSQETIPPAQLTEKQIAGQDWRRQLEGVHNTIYNSVTKRFTKEEHSSQAIRVAILDTGLQLSDALQENYVEENRIAANDCKSFCSSAWDTDVDGHGSHIGQIILDMAPHTQVYVAKICERRKDFTNQRVKEVQENITKAIHHATTVWDVDVIIMSFGFEERVPEINTAMEESMRAAKPPLYFAATCNDGAHRSIAWPAREFNVFGISSTDGDGYISTFNPDDNESYPIFYAFGDGVKVQSKAADGSFSTKFVSGTSFAAPVAAALVANLLSCVRLGIKTMAPEDAAVYSDLPRQLQQMNNMVKVMRHCMQTKNQQKRSSLLPWELLNSPLAGDGGLLQTVLDTLNKR